MDRDLLSIQEARSLAHKGHIAAEKIADYTEEQIDKILCNMVEVAEENAALLAQMAVEETGFGRVEDKTFKNQLASTILYNDIKDIKTIGVIDRNENNKTISVASPMGLIMGILPSTNPTSTAIYKSLIAIKARNAIVFSPHPGAIKSTGKAIELMHDAAVAAGAPENIIGVIKTLSMDATHELMKDEYVKMLVATGGPGMVKAAYSSGTPALGVGAGNAPAYIEKTADIKKAVKNIVDSKTFDNGVVCSSEQSIIVEECNRDRVIEELKKQGCYFMNPEESKKVSQVLFSDGSSIIDAGMVGKKPEFIASVAGIEIPNDTKILIGEGEGVGPEYPLSYEKLTPVLAFYTVRDWLEAWKLSKKLLQNGLGHTMVIHTENENMVMEFSKMPISRIVVNTGGAQGGTGASTGLMPSFTLGCGTWGGSSVSENVGPMNLINIKKIAYGIEKSAAESLDASVNNIEAGNSKSLYNNEDYLQNSPSSYASRVRQSTLSTKEAESNCTNENQGLIKIMEGLIAELGRDK